MAEKKQRVALADPQRCFYYLFCKCKARLFKEIGNSISQSGKQTSQSELLQTIPSINAPFPSQIGQVKFSKPPG